MNPRPKLTFEAPRDSNDSDFFVDPQSSPIFLSLLSEIEGEAMEIAEILSKAPQDQTGAASHWLKENKHLARSLRKAAHKELKRWTYADGMILDRKAENGPELVLDHERLLQHLPKIRSYSPTALQHFTACPYRFYLYAICEIRPEQKAPPHISVSPLTKGNMAHEIQFRILTEQREKKELPLPQDEQKLLAILKRLQEHTEAVASDLFSGENLVHKSLWDETVRDVFADLSEWLLRLSESDPFVPSYFELAFGLDEKRVKRQKGQKDPDSSAEPVWILDRLWFRGSIDLVEISPDGRARACDYKTGKKRTEDGLVIKGGESLQPALYALVLEKIFPQHSIDGSRLYYCSHTGKYESVYVALNDKLKDAVVMLLDSLSELISKGFFPRAPKEGACIYCDYRELCRADSDGLRTEAQEYAHKPTQPLQSLFELRAHP